MKKASSSFMFVLLLVSTLVFSFNLQGVRATGTIYIRADGSTDPLTAPIQSNVLSASSVPPQTEWNKTYGGTHLDVGQRGIQTSDGGYAIVGDTDSFGAGGTDFWLVKTDVDGSMQWNRTYGGTGTEGAYALVQTAEGGYALAGYTSSYGAGGHDFWLVKTDANGNSQWNKTYGGTSTDHALSIVQTYDGGYAIAGSTMSFGAGNRDVWLIRTDANGNSQWNKTYGGTGYDAAYWVAQTNEGGYILMATTQSFGAGECDFWLVKTDSAGNTQWNKTYGGTDEDRGGSHVQTSNGGYALIGCTNSFGAGDYDFWLIKTTPAVLPPIAYVYSGWGMDTMLDEMSYLNSLDPPKYSFEFFNEVNISDLWSALPDYRALLIDEDTFYSDPAWAEYGGPIYGNFTQHSNELASWVIEGGGIFASGENDLLRSQTWDWLPPGMRVTSYDPESTSSVHIVSDPGLYSEPNAITNAYLSGGHTHAYFTSWDQGYLTTVRRDDNDESIELFGIFGRNGGVIVVSHIEAEAMLNTWEYMQNQLDYASPAYPPWVLTITQPSEGSKLEAGNPVTITATIIDGDTGNPGAGATVTANAPNGTLLTLTETSPGIYVTTYTVKETDSQGNWTINAVGIIGGKFPKDSVAVKVALHNVAITKVQSSKTVVGHGYDTGANVTVADQGDYTETFDVTLYTQSQTTVNETGLVGYWKFDEGGGTTAYDSSGNGKRGLIYGAAWTDGKYGKALSLDGSGDYIVVGNSTALNPSTALTISAWVFAKSYSGVGGGQRTIVERRLYNSDHSYQLMIFPEGFHEGRVRFSIWSNNVEKVVDSADAVPLDQWCHVAATYDGGNAKIYLNGTQDAAASISGNIDSTSINTTIGAGSQGTTNFFNGTIDEVRIYSRSLSAEEIAVIAEVGLVGYWKFDEGAGTAAYDSSGNNNMGTLINEPQWVDGKISKALSFDGVDDYVRVEDSPSISSPSATGAITVIAWVKPDPGFLDRFARVVASHWSDGEGYGYAWVLEAHDDMRYHSIIVASDDTNHVDLPSSTPVQEGVWQHVAFTWDGSFIKFYFNGVIDATAPYAFNMKDSTRTMQIGKTDQLWYVWKGLIDEAKVYNRSLSAEEVWTEYSSARVAIQEQTVTLESGASTTLNFSWNTTGFAMGNYTVSAYAWPFQGETSTEDNTFIGDTVLVTIPGDINGDQYVNAKDAVLLGSAFYPAGMYNPNADINDDGYCNAKDAIILGTYFGQHWS